MLEKLIDIFKNNYIHDIYILGFVDIEDGFADFYSDKRCYYFEVGKQYIKFKSVNQYSKLSVNIVNSIRYEFEIDEDMLPCKTSVSQIILIDSMSAKNKVKSIIINGIDLKDKNQIICDSLQLNLENGQEVFFDPTFYYGINIGGAQQRKFWIENLENGIKPDEITIEV
jgi:hypothetical protein